MVKKVYNKLVRDKIPDIIKADGKAFKTRILDDKEHLAELIKKLTEEIKEFEAGPSADIKEITIAIREALGIHAGQLEDARRQKPLPTAALNKKSSQKV